jgi:hypothetical protein
MLGMLMELLKASLIHRIEKRRKKSKGFESSKIPMEILWIKEAQDKNIFIHTAMDKHQGENTDKTHSNLRLENMQHQLEIITKGHHNWDLL